MTELKLIKTQNPKGGPPKVRPEVTDELLQKIEEWAVEYTQAMIAWKLDMSQETFRKWLKEDERVALAYKKGMGRQEHELFEGLFKQAKAGDKASAMFLLKTRHQWRETSRIEHSGDGGINVGLHNTGPEKGEDEGAA